MYNSIYPQALAQEWARYAETDNPEGSREREIFPAIKQWLESIQPALLVDLGCGQGKVAELVTDKTNYVGIEGSDFLIDRARKQYGHRHILTQGDIYHIPLQADTVDAVMSIWVWSHLDNLILAAAEMSRILKPNGAFLVVSAHPETYEIRKTFYSNYQIQGNQLVGNFDLGDGQQLTQTSLYFHSLGQIEDAIKGAGLRVTDKRSMGMSKAYPPGLYIWLSGIKATAV